MIVLFLICCNNLHQSYDYYISKSDSCYQIKDYSKAGLYADSAFIVKNGNKDSYYNAACCWALVNCNKKAIDYLNKAVDNGYVNINWLCNDKDLSCLHDTQQWNDLIKKIQSKIDVYEAHMNKPLKRELELILNDDQKYRGIIDSIESKYGTNSKELKALWKRIDKTDSIDLVKVIDVIEKNGWPGISLVGENANQAVWLVIQHADLKVQEKYLPFLKQSVLKGESNGTDLALLEDRILLGNHKPQIYGTQLVRDSVTNKFKLAVIIDEINVNKRRAEVGLGKIEDYAKSFGIEYKINKK